MLAAGGETQVRRGRLNEAHPILLARFGQRNAEQFAARAIAADDLLLLLIEQNGRVLELAAVAVPFEHEGPLEIHAAQIPRSRAFSLHLPDRPGGRFGQGAGLGRVGRQIGDDLFAGLAA